MGRLRRARIAPRSRARGVTFLASIASLGLSAAVSAEGWERVEEDGSGFGYEASYALVIGIDAYTGGWPRLHNAVRDAKEVAEALEGIGFAVDLRTDLTSESFQRTIKSFFVRRGAEPDARLLLWYAGHGHTIDGEGFLVPADAPVGTDPSFKMKVLHMRDFGSYSRLARSKHVLSIFDSCFSGTIFDSRRAAAPASITHVAARPVRQFISSGDEEQTVMDDGTFRDIFVKSLAGIEPSDLNRDGYLTASELGLYIADRVTNLTMARQTPRYGKLRDKDYDLGDFVLTVPGGGRDGDAGKARDGAAGGVAERGIRLRVPVASEPPPSRPPRLSQTGQSREPRPGAEPRAPRTSLDMSYTELIERARRGGRRSPEE